MLKTYWNEISDHHTYGGSNSITRELFTQHTVLTPNELREVNANLPKPAVRKVMGNVVFDIYIAKDLFVNSWNHEIVTLLVNEARKSYHIYGDTVPSLDEYDSKSAVYLVRVTYNYPVDNVQIPVSEFFSMRFVPASGIPESTEDIEFYYDKLSSRSVIELLEEKFLTTEGFCNTIADKIITLSRICAVRPFAHETSFDTALSIHIHSKTKPTKNQYTSVAFALCNKYFFERHTERFYFVTAQLHTKLKKDILVYPPKKPVVRLPFSSADTFFGLEKHSIVINRMKEGVYAYQYPGYFLKLKDGIRFIDELVKIRQIDVNHVECLLEEGISWARVKKHPHIRHMKNMGVLFQEVIGTAELSGDVHGKIGDGPQLHVMRVNKWSNGISTFVEHVTDYLLLN